MPVDIDAGMEGRLNKSVINDPNRYRRENALHKFTSYTTVFTLSAINPDELNNPQTLLTNAPHDIIARTGGIGNSTDFGETLSVDQNITGSGSVAEQVFAKDRLIKKHGVSESKMKNSQKVLKQNRDIFFERVVIDAYPSPNPDRKLMNFTKIEMELTEPMGISFWEKCRAAAANNGYFFHPSAPFLLTLEFKGFDDNGNMVDSGVPKRLYPIRMSESNLQMDAGGTRYTVSAQPWTEFGMVNTFLYVRGSGNISGTGRSMESYFGNLKKRLDEIGKEEKQAGLRDFADEYKITIDPKVGVQSADFENQLETTGTIDLGSIKAIDLRPGMSIVKVIEDLVKQMPDFRDIAAITKKYWKEVESAQTDTGDLPAYPSEWVPWFKIITTVTPDTSRFDRRLKTHPNTVHYHVAPYRIHILNFARAGMGGKTTWGRYVKKEFNYIYTGENHDVLDFNIVYNAGYYKSVLRNSKLGEGTPKNLSIVEKVARLAGLEENYPEPELPLSHAITVDQSSTPGNAEADDVAAVQEFYDYLTNPQGDMVNLEMQVMGDPAFLGQDHAMPMPLPTGPSYVRVAGLKGNEFDEQAGCFNFDNAEPLVRVNFRFPNDINHDQGLYEFTTEATPQFSGLYRVNRVESVFQGGKFTQNLEMTRFNNQKGASDVKKFNDTGGIDDATYG